MSASSSSKKAASKSSNTFKEKSFNTESRKTSNSPLPKKKNGKPCPKPEKQFHGLQDLIKKMKPSREELLYRSEKSKNIDVIEKYSKYFRCTKCQKNYQPVLNKNDELDVHPVLGVLMCFDCRNYYGDGDFSMDSDGEDKYCRWCGEGGTLFSCSECVFGFCNLCIRKQFGLEYLKRVEKDDDWVCFFCNPRPLWHQRFVASVAEQAAKLHTDPFETKDQRLIKNVKNKQRKRIVKKDETHSEESESDFPALMQQKMKAEKRRSEVCLSSGEDSDKEAENNCRKRLKIASTLDQIMTRNIEESLCGSEDEKLQILKKLQNILKLTECQMSLGFDWSQKKLNKLKMADGNTSMEKLKKECQKIKWFISVISSYLVGFCTSVDLIEKTLGQQPKLNNENTSLLPVSDHLAYNGILQFLGFVMNQVKTFDEKGIRLQDLFTAEVYEDENVLGFKKNSATKNCAASTSKPCCSNSLEPTTEVSNQKSEHEQPVNEPTQNKNEGDKCENISKVEEAPPESGVCGENKGRLKECTSQMSGNSEDLGPRKNDAPEEVKRTSDEGNQNNWQNNANGEDVQNIITILESA